VTASYSPSSRGNRSRRAPIPSVVQLTVAYLHSLLLIDRMVSVTHQWSRRRHALLPTARPMACLDVVTHHDDAVDGGPCIGLHLNNRPLLSLLSAKFASSTSPQKPPATYTRVNDFGPHMDSIFRRRLIRESDLYASIYGTSYSAIVLRNLSVCDVRALCRWYFTFRHFAG